MKFVFICEPTQEAEYSLLGEVVSDSNNANNWALVDQEHIASPTKKTTIKIVAFANLVLSDEHDGPIVIDVTHVPMSNFMEKLFTDIKLLQKAFIPCIVLHENGRVLGLTYCNKQSIIYSMEHRTATFFSRETNKLWIKGLTSGNYFPMVKFQINGECILFIVKGNLFCHFNKKSCFNFRQPLSGDLINMAYDILQKSKAQEKTAQSKENLSLSLIIQASRLWGSFLKDHVIDSMGEMIQLILRYSLENNISISKIIQKQIMNEECLRKCITDFDKEESSQVLRLGCSIPYFSKETEALLLNYNIILDQKKGLTQKAHFKNSPNEEIQIIPAKPKDIYRLIHYKILDIVICNDDVLENYPAEYVTYKIPIASNPLLSTRIALIGKENTTIEDVKDSLIFTEYMTITDKWLQKHNIRAYTTQISGAAEGYIVNGLCDFCVCIVYSGTTINQNKLKVIDILYESSVNLHIRKDRETCIQNLLR